MYLRSIELRDYTGSHRLEVIKRIDLNRIIVRLHPPIPSHVYKTDTELAEVMLAARFVGDALPPVSLANPTIVNICLPKTGAATLDAGPWNIKDIGQISEEG